MLGKAKSNELKMEKTDNAVSVLEVDLEEAHGLNDGNKALDSVVVHHRGVLAALLVSQPMLVYDPTEGWSWCGELVSLAW